MNPRLFCRERSFDKAILLTYSFDPVFFEQVVLSDLWAGRASDILVIGDGKQVNSSVQSTVGQLWHLGKRYLLANAKHTGSFHPKVLLRLGPTEGAVMVGSGNLTSCGWGANKEISCAWMMGPEHPDKGAWLLPFLDDVISWCVNDLEKDAVRRMKDVAWLGLQSADPLTTIRLIYSRGNRALAPALAERWLGRKFTEVFILTGSTDEGGAFLRWAHRTFGIERAVIALTPSQATFSLHALADLPLELRLVPSPYKSPLHAKFYFFDGPDGAAALMGSPNCSAAAWLLSPENGGNIETALVYDTAQRADFNDVLEIFDLPAMSPEEVLVGVDSIAADADDSHSPYDLIGLRWDAGSNRLLAIISPQPEPGTSVALLLGEDQIPMRSIHGDGEDHWVCEISDGIEFSSAEFASATLERGEDHWLTGVRWIDHLAELRHSSQTARFLEPIKGLESGGSFSEQRRILEDLQQVAHALFSDSGAFRDSGFGVAPEPRESPDAPAPPVDPVALIRNLEDAPDAITASGNRTTSNLSLTGILRLLFDAERTVLGNEAAADDDKLDEGPASNPITRQAAENEAVPNEIKEPVEVKLQSRLAAQIEVFIQNLSKAEFASACTATQMVQAVCFPLAVAVRGQARAWVSNPDAERWAIAVVSLLFRGKTSNSPGLLRAVEQRYMGKGQSVLFREIVGDGTLLALAF
jgi:hypothetical protein